MIIVMKQNSSEKHIEAVAKKVKEMGYTPKILKGVIQSVIACIGDERGKEQLQSLEVMEGVEKIMRVLVPYKLASKEANPAGTKIDIGYNVEIGGKRIVVIAGPCSVESKEQLFKTAEEVKKSGARALRGGAFKPRTSPYSFQGLGAAGLEILKEAGKMFKLPVVTEVMDPHEIPLLEEFADVIQVGARNIQNFALLKRLGELRKPILLKRGMMTTIDELLMSTEYLLSGGNSKVILCERGIRTFETATRNTLDISAVPVLKSKTHLPVVVDPSHGTGYTQFVAPMSFAAIAAGADGLLVEVHPQPEKALSDGFQSLKPDAFSQMMKKLKNFVTAAGRSI